MQRSSSVFVLMLCLGCAGEDPAEKPQPDAGPSCNFTLTWGTRDPGGGFTPFVNGDDAEITLGFQGFRYILSALRLEDVKATTATHAARVAVEGQAPYTLADTLVKLHSEGGVLFSDDVLVFFNDLPIADLVGKSAEISLAAKAGGCLGTTARTLTLRDDESCIQAEDGGLSCQSSDGGP